MKKDNEKKYHEGVGRRKTAVARVRLSKGSGSVTVNELTADKFFSMKKLLAVAIAPLANLNMAKDFDISAHVKGGGVSAQAEAIRHGVARALVKTDETLKKSLRDLGFLTRDPRMVERKKYGLKKARRSPQWAKR
jgi:small subunit ribosomal protein S9